MNNYSYLTGRQSYVIIILVIFSFCLSHIVASQPNPTEARELIGGNFPDPSILKYNGKYYLTHTSYTYRPGLLILESDDLKMWKPVTYALNNFEGNVWAPELIEHNGKFFIYIPSAVDDKFGNYVITADHIEGPWTEAKRLEIGHIDPGHVVGDDGQRYIHVSAGYAAKLSDDGLDVISEPLRVHEGWPIPQDWAIECFCLESPKFTKRKDWYYLTAAQGGTFGPSTSHMATAFRSKSPIGPWENSPYNPVVKTWSRKEQWWSKGHGTLVEGPQNQWFMILHGILNGHRSLGRATLIEPIVWDKQGWYKVPNKWPKGFEQFTVDLPLSDEFEGTKIGMQWQFFEKYEVERTQLQGGKLIFKGKGDSPADSRPLTLIPRDQAYEFETELTVQDGARAGLMFWVSPTEYMGLSIDASGQVLREQRGYRYYKATETPKLQTGRVGFKIVNDNQDVRFYLKQTGGDWQIMQPSMDISQNGIVRLALFVHGDGEGTFDYFRYKKLD